eukprot:scaffold20543_cov95-Cylindrotheca_fusiformis.AAC.1
MSVMFVLATTRRAFVSSFATTFSTTLPRAVALQQHQQQQQYAPTKRRNVGTAFMSYQDSNEQQGDVKPTWTYVPYNDPYSSTTTTSSRTSRSFSTWQVPKTVDIPEDRLEINFVRSSGSGGQNVNKLSTKVELRFHVMDADWMPREVRQRLVQQQSNRINKDGYLTLTSQESRTQGQNRKTAVDKLRSM